MSEPILTVANMNKKFGSTVALNDVSLTVYPGEIRGLIGENGSGKSTVTSIVAGMQECDSGAMTFQGQSWKPLSMIDALHKGIGMIVQESGTIPGITVAENIFLAESEKYKNKFGLINRKKMNADATRVMKNIGVNDVTGEMLMQKLDFQTRKLVEIAKVVMKEPQILVIDETSTALSHDGREILYDIMNRFRKENKSVMFISHDLRIIKHFCDRVMVMYLGNIVEIGTKDAIYEKRRHPYTQALLSAIPNIRKQENEHRILLTGDIPSPVNPPSGCPFHPRCRYCMDICKKEKPQLKTMADGTQVACHLNIE